MPATTTKAKMVRALEELPDDASIEDAIERLLFLHKVEVGLRQVQEGQTVPLGEVESRLQQRRESKQG